MQKSEDAMARTLKKSEAKPSMDIKIKAEKKFGLTGGRFIICKNCGNMVTAPENIITVNGNHDHEFTNPEGFTYEIGCFSAADGCIVYGDPVTEHTWFEGFGWSFTVCSQCMIHLGWYYQREKDSFFGLILDLLADSSLSH